jgi:hypothetical protein
MTDLNSNRGVIHQTALPRPSFLTDISIGKVKFTDKNSMAKPLVNLGPQIPNIGPNGSTNLVYNLAYVISQLII